MQNLATIKARENPWVLKTFFEKFGGKGAAELQKVSHLPPIQSHILFSSVPTALLRV